ncbi:MAG TPA: hypothetical protein VM577_10770 [Anaerovoracaceae bacterium]|nr:hypothetical protein [Anaerovoracaceae bacterium]
MFTRRQFLKEENGSMILPMICFVLITLAFMTMLWEVGNALFAKMELREYADAAAMGGSVKAAVGYSSATGHGSGENGAIVLKSAADNMANDIMEANIALRNQSTGNKMEVTHYEYNNEILDIDNKHLNSEEQYYAGYFTIDGEANYYSSLENILEPFIYKMHSRVHTVPD